MHYTELLKAREVLTGPGGEFELGQVARSDHPEWGELLW